MGANESIEITMQNEMNWMIPSENVTTIERESESARSGRESMKIGSHVMFARLSRSQREIAKINASILYMRCVRHFVQSIAQTHSEYSIGRFQCARKILKTCY